MASCCYGRAQIIPSTPMVQKRFQSKDTGLSTELPPTRFANRLALDQSFERRSQPHPHPLKVRLWASEPISIAPSGHFKKSLALDSRAFRAGTEGVLSTAQLLNDNSDREIGTHPVHTVGDRDVVPNPVAHNGRGTSCGIVCIVITGHRRSPSRKAAEGKKNCHRSPEMWEMYSIRRFQHPF